MKVQHRSKLVRSLTPEDLKHLLSWPNQKAHVLDVLRQIQRTKEFFGPERRIDTKVRLPETWTEMRETLRNLTPKRNYGIALIYRGKCRGCGGRFNATSPRKHYCSNKCEKKAEYQTRLEQGDFKKGMARTRQRKHQAKDAETKQQKKMKKQQERLKASELYREILSGKFEKKNPRHKYNTILDRLGNGDQVKGHKKIVDWDRQKFKFESISNEDQTILITWIHE